MTARPVLRDERTVAAENASYRWAYLVLSFGLLAATAWRSLVADQPAWDLLALVLVGGGVAAVHQGRARVLGARWALLSLAAALVAAAAVALLAMLR
jgi:hypothetical protein